MPAFFDEAYYELEDRVASRAGWIKDYPHMLVNRTFSKAFGLAGFRIGYLLCDAGLANYFNRVKIPWNVSLIALAAALAGLEDEQDQEYKRQTPSAVASISTTRSTACRVSRPSLRRVTLS